MKILTLVTQPYPDITGGSIIKLLGETKYLTKYGHQVHLVSSRGGNPELHIKEAKDYSSLKRVGLPYVPLGKSKHIFLLFKMMLWGIVNLSYFICAFIYSLWIIKDIDVISIKGIHSDGLCGVLLKKLFKKRLVYEHAGGFNIKRKKLFKHMNRGKFLTRLGLWFNTFTEKIVYKNCDAIMTQDNLENYYRELGFEGTYHVVPNGRDPETYYPRDASETKKEYNIKGKVVLFVGRLVPVKNIDKIIESFHSLNGNYSLVIVGDGDLREELHKVAQEMKGSKDVHFVGTQKDVTQFYNLADILVIASDYEGFPGVLIEAMGCGKVVVAAPVGVIPKVIIDNVNGFLLPKDWTNHDLTKCMFKGLNALESIKLKSKRTFDNNYSWDIVIQKFIKIYQG